MSKHYIIKDGKLVRTNPFCPRCGKGVFMADHGDFYSCGKCGDRYNKRFFRFHKMQKDKNHNKQKKMYGRQKS